MLFQLVIRFFKQLLRLLAGAHISFLDCLSHKKNQ